MTTIPSGEANISTCGDSGSSDSPVVGSPSQVSLPADVPAASVTAASAKQQDVDQASIKPATSKATFGDRDKHEAEAAAGHRQDPKETTTQLAHPAPNALQTSVSLQHPGWDRPAPDSRMTQSLRVSRSDSLVKKEIPRTVSVPEREQDLVSSSPSAELRVPQKVLAASIADTDGQLDTRATDSVDAVENPESPEALVPDTEALPSAESQVVTEWDSADPSGHLQARPAPPSPGGSVPPSSAASAVALGRWSLDPSLCVAGEEHIHTCSTTSLLGGGEGSISSLANILVWSEAAMSVTTGFLASSHSSVTGLQPSPAPSLHSIPSILRNAGLALSSRLVAGTVWALRSVTCMLDRVEQRIADSIHLAVCYLISQLTPRRPGSNCD
ncbi:testis-expressed protein 44 [Saccopteryx bilineata]|uniref:testis-expressed protein 44 n=1 Tax=Saccopteryx bilineata TaxID=59482 RepID=UPI0033900CE2